MPLKSIIAKKKIRLDHLPRALGISGDELAKAVELGGVQVNGKRIKKNSTVVSAGDRVSVCWGETPPDFSFSPEWIIFEDDWLICVNKPAGMTTQGTRCFDVNHLYFFIKQHLNGYVGLHHRLDRDTTGLVLFTKNRGVNRAVGALFREKTIRKRYYAIVHGEVKHPFIIEQPIGRVPDLTPARYWINGENPKPAVTEIAPLGVRNGLSLVSASPRTGRTHQIRVHLASAGFPIVGDSFYNHDESLRNLRPLLHCAQLAFPHPVTGKSLTLHAPLPEDFKSFLEEKGFEPV